MQRYPLLQTKWIKQGRLAEAQSWARKRGLSVDDDFRYLREFEHITWAQPCSKCEDNPLNSTFG